MSKKFKSQASSTRAAATAFGSPSLFGFGTPTGFRTAASPLSYVTEQADLSGISDPNVVVAFKNLGKKDSTTKTKALEELHEYFPKTATSETTVETAVLEAWINLYPRTSIDNSRRVRQLAHSLQGSLTTSSGKRIATYLSRAVGPWLCGTYDADKGVSRAAQDALAAAFPQPEKRATLWKIYTESLCEYAEDAILVQTPQTLSDERITSPDDAETKHVRAAGTAILMLAELIQQKATGKSESHDGKIAQILGQSRLWEYAFHRDPYLRRSIYTLLPVCLSDYQSDLNWQMVSTCFIAKALHISQLGSARQYSEVLLAITKAHPEVWTTDYHAKTLVSRRFAQYLKQGSQRGTQEVWTNIGLLVREVPAAVWSHAPDLAKTNLDDIEALLTALHEGINSPDEPRPNLLTAWNTYLDLYFWLESRLESGPAREQLLDKHVFPLVFQHVLNVSDQAPWSVPVTNSSKVSSRILRDLICSGRLPEVENLWCLLTAGAIDAIKMSQPETSTNFKSSQDETIAIADRLLGLEGGILASGDEELQAAKACCQPGNIHLVEESIEILKTRKGKPYSAAGAILAVLPFLSHVSPKLDSFLRHELADLLGTPSSERLVAILLRCQEYPSQAEGIKSCLEAFLTSVDLQSHQHAFLRLLQGLPGKVYNSNRELGQYMLQSLDLALAGDTSRWTVVNAALVNVDLDSKSGTGNEQNGTDQSLQEEMLQKIVAGLAIRDTQQNALRGLETILSHHHVEKSTVAEQLAANLLPKLLVAEDSHNHEISAQATSVLKKLKDILKTTGTASVAESTIDLLQTQFEGTGQPLSIFGMIELAQQVLRDASEIERSDLSSRLVPTKDQWGKALEALLKVSPRQSMAIISPLQGAIYAIDNERSTTPPHFSRDADDLSVAMRLVMYVTSMLRSTALLKHVSENQLHDLYAYYPLVLQLVNEKLSSEFANQIWTNSTPEVAEEASAVLSQGRDIIREWAQNNTDGPNDTMAHSRFVSYWLEQLPTFAGNSSRAYYLGLTFTSVMSMRVDAEGPARYTDLWSADLKRIRMSKDLIQSAALLAVIHEGFITSADGRRLCNELVADATAIDDLSDPVATLRPLVLLNILVQNVQHPFESIPTQRLVYLLKNLTRLLRSEDAPYALMSEVMKLLGFVLPAVRDIYGEHWEEILDVLETLWIHEDNLKEDLPTLHSSLRLYSHMRSLLGDDANEDLLEAWKRAKPALEAGLLQVLQLFGTPLDGVDQPRDITASLLSRQVSSIDTSALEPLEDVYPLLAADEVSIQSAAYGLLHRAIPQRQEQASLDFALDKKVAHLPEELLSLLLDVPGRRRPSLAALMSDHQARESLLKDMRRYLLSWAVVFDHFDNASYKLKELYSDDIKGCGHLGPLLDFVSEQLRITTGRPIDGSKFDIDHFVIDQEDYKEKEVQWLSVYLYYRCLFNLPSLTKDWFIEQKNRIKTPLESWTQKHMTPLLVSASLATVTEWAHRQDPDDHPIAIKASPKGSELVASINVDEESAPISLAISLPGAYPLEQAVVSTRNRVVVSEKNWQSWLRTFQVIIFSSGSLIEGLVAFRRNVQGALSGQTECAICYSIIGTDMQTPNKKCGTCKNTFHSTCLFRWFKSSNSSSCPLCRNNFNYA